MRYEEVASVEQITAQMRQFSRDMNEATIALQESFMKLVAAMQEGLRQDVLRVAPNAERFIVRGSTSLDEFDAEAVASVHVPERGTVKGYGRDWFEATEDLVTRLRRA